MCARAIVTGDEVDALALSLSMSAPCMDMGGSRATTRIVVMAKYALITPSSDDPFVWWYKWGRRRPFSLEWALLHTGVSPSGAWAVIHIITAQVGVIMIDDKTERVTHTQKIVSERAFPVALTPEHAIVCAKGEMLHLKVVDDAYPGTPIYDENNRAYDLPPKTPLRTMSGK